MNGMMQGVLTSLSSLMDSFRDLSLGVRADAMIDPLCSCVLWKMEPLARESPRRYGRRSRPACTQQRFGERHNTLDAAKSVGAGAMLVLADRLGAGRSMAQR